MENFLSKNLKYLRELNGLTQGEVAIKLRINMRRYQRWEYGTSEPNIKELIKLAKLYKTTVDNLVLQDATTIYRIHSA